MFPPLSSSRAGGTRQSRFRHDVLLSERAIGPAAPVRTAAVPDCFFKGKCSSWDGLRNCSFCTPSQRGLPVTLNSTVHRQSAGSRPWPASRSEAVLSRAVCAGTAAVRTALPVPVVSNWSLAIVSSMVMVTHIHSNSVSRVDAGRVTVRLLAASLVRTYGVIRPGVVLKASVR